MKNRLRRKMNKLARKLEIVASEYFEHDMVVCYVEAENVIPIERGEDTKEENRNQN